MFSFCVSSVDVLIEALAGGKTASLRDHLSVPDPPALERGGAGRVCVVMRWGGGGAGAVCVDCGP